MPAYSSSPTARQKKALVAGALTAAALVGGAGAAAAAHAPGFYEKPSHSKVLNPSQFQDHQDQCHPVAGFLGC